MLENISRLAHLIFKATKMQYKTKHSESDEFIVYRKFHYTPSQIIEIRGFLSIVFLSIAIFLLIPDMDDVFIFTAVSSFLNRAIHISLQKGFLLAAAIYKGTGLIFLVLALVFGGRYMRAKLERKINHAKSRFKKDL